MKRQLLLITYYFPPYNLTESRRALMIARAAVRGGWHVDVVAPWVPHFHSSGEFKSWEQYFPDPDSITVFRTRGGFQEIAPRFYSYIDALLDRLTRFKNGKYSWAGLPLRILLRFPDPCVTWLWFLIPRLLKMSRTIHPNVVISSSYPYTSHIAGLVVSKFIKCSWILDMRDGWAVDEEEDFLKIEPSPVLRRWHARLMKSMMKRASQVWSITPGIRDATVDYLKTSEIDKYLSVIQGYDSEALESLGENGHHYPKICDQEGLFILGYAGRFRPNSTPVEAIAQALSYLKIHNPQVYSRIKLLVWGPSRKDYLGYLEATVHYYQLEECLQVLDSLPESQLICMLNDQCDALLITNGSFRWSQKRLTTKLFTYLAAQRPILAICEPESEISKLVHSAALGVAIPARDINHIGSILMKWREIKIRMGYLPYNPDIKILDFYSLQKGVLPLMLRNLEKVVGLESQGTCSKMF